MCADQYAAGLWFSFESPLLCAAHIIFPANDFNHDWLWGQVKKPKQHSVKDAAVRLVPPFDELHV